MFRPDFSSDDFIRYMDLSVIIVSWKVRDKLRGNLETILKSLGDFKFEVIVIDNNSQDGTVEMVASEFREVKLISNSENRGFAAANNQGMKIAQGKYLLLLNPDMRVEVDTLSKMLNWMDENPSATVSGCKLVSEEGNIVKQVRKFPKLSDQLAIIFKLPHVFKNINNKYLCADFDYNRSSKVDSIRGAFFFISRERFKIVSGGREPFLDERYFIWFEEVDFCKTIYQLGGEVWYTPAANCLDYVGQSFKQVELGQTQRYFSESMIKYFAKWGNKLETAVLKLAWRLVLMFLPK